jgi:hypothetical protein
MRVSFRTMHYATARRSSLGSPLGGCHTTRGHRAWLEPSCLTWKDSLSSEGPLMGDQIRGGQ